LAIIHGVRTLLLSSYREVTGCSGGCFDGNLFFRIGYPCNLWLTQKMINSDADETSIRYRRAARPFDNYSPFWQRLVFRRRAGQRGTTDHTGRFAGPGLDDTS